MYILGPVAPYTVESHTICQSIPHIYILAKIEFSQVVKCTQGINQFVILHEKGRASRSIFTVIHCSITAPVYDHILIPCKNKFFFYHICSPK